MSVASWNTQEMEVEPWLFMFSDMEQHHLCLELGLSVII